MKRQHRRPSRPSQRLIAGLLSAAIVLGVGYGPASAHPSTVHAAREPTASAPAPEDLTSTAGRIVWHLTSGRQYRAAAETPSGFVAMFGYRPQMQAGYPVDPAGGCSSPIALPQRFEVLCRSHDFGYDVLRFADRTGHRLGGWARLRLDRMLVQRMHTACTSPLCQAAATAADLGLRLNTWRQFDGPPAPTESTAAIVTSGVGRGWAALHERGAR
ncbi:MULTISPECIES: hypothetical protein [Gordonia]|uniref:Phospholipase n=2 Tax=Gordonia TaxID=2053 RepID=A0A9X3I550_9ACTN|nr:MULTISPECIES: hypothetical protein [Gordonia]MCF3937882.1 hypothetical protein [Gordonia tangerina]MCX2964680.1 hypothetical protein [Gordonia aquimaris]